MKQDNKSDFDQLSVLIEAGAPEQLAAIVAELHPSEVALLIESLPPEKRQIVWNFTNADDEGDVLLELNDEVRTGLLESITAEEVLAATEGMELDDLADLVADLPQDITDEVINALSIRDRQRLESVMAWPEDTAGGLMNPDAVSVQPEVTVDLALRYLRTLGELPDNTNSIFVVDTKNRYQGTVLLSKLVTSNPQNQVKEILDKEAEAIDVSASEAEVAKVFTGLDMVTAAVVDDAGLLLGQITIDDVVDVIQELADHDILSRAGLDEDDDMFAPVVSSSRRRAVWLGANLATGFLAAAVVSVFQPTIEKVVILAVLMPVVASMGGIAGSQTLTLMIRGMALGRVQDSNQRWLLRKELSVAVLNGIIWAAVVAVVTMLFFASWKVGLIIAAALAINLLAAALAGFSIPLILRRLNIDPALAGGVVLTTFTDVIGFVAFLGLGALFLT
jgi:magnesium transporter|tara:strand:- start:4066 stop:5409 length:1344 start_codon:yes stop_codon:yes gene_type:complete